MNNIGILFILALLFYKYFIGYYLSYKDICLSLFLVAIYDKIVKQIIYYKRNGSLDNFTVFNNKSWKLYRVRARKQINYFSNDEYVSLRQYFFDVLDEDLNNIIKLMY